MRVAEVVCGNEKQKRKVPFAGNALQERSLGLFLGLLYLFLSRCDTRGNGLGNEKQKRKVFFAVSAMQATSLDPFSWHGSDSRLLLTFARLGGGEKCCKRVAGRAGCRVMFSIT